MKKFAFLLMITFSLASCSLEDDGPNTLLEFAEITEVDLPEYFESGESYDIVVTYLLPSACHTFNGFDARQGQGSNSNEIFIGVVTSYDANLAQCNKEEDNLSREATLKDVTITGEVGTVYTFKFWVGQDSSGETQYYTVEVPVEDPDAPGEEEE
ncbi:hypothetical protein [Salegentibacter sediminis]|uniref:hypothetical protein n=1 Tax=Salegentibacter sediminis TaxID=1930251 RepID=UPI0012FF6382|nr:hypothetical protein [Salegentibacter sediminis]